MRPTRTAPVCAHNSASQTRVQALDNKDISQLNDLRCKPDFAGTKSPMPAGYRTNQLDSLRLEPSDYGVEIGGDSSYDDLPREPHLISPTRLCAACRERKALFQYRGRVKRDRDHDLCPQCYRALINRMASIKLG
jgi:hypothetical protein